MKFGVRYEIVYELAHELAGAKRCALKRTMHELPR
jgi:hypothetical protein